MPGYAVIGGQWGDEGKGKIVDFLSQDTQYVVRYSGGNNAGHTVINKLGQFALHLVPAGIFWPKVTCVIGNGVVVDPGVLLEEIATLEKAGVNTSRLLISDRAHLIMPYHVALDQLEERAKGSQAIGTTGKGVGPAYMDKVGRVGIRVGELLDVDNEEVFLPHLDHVLKQKNAIITKVYGGEPFSLAEIYQKCLEWGDLLRPYIQPTEMVLQEAIASGDNVLIEGAQGAMLDIDHGTYPYVTSSSPSIGGAYTGLGIPPQSIAGSLGVFKAYTTRVGGGPLVTELNDATGDKIRELAWEYGATTGRPRRVGWFDGVAARYSANLNGFTSIVLTRLDVLDGFPSVKVCVGYQLDGKVVDRIPSNVAILARCQPVYEEFEGWDQPTASATEMEKLPPNALKYVHRLEELIGVPIDLISTGPRREETIVNRPFIKR
ncbi:MAG: adenylosuccinate synthase [Chloroflexi bacterium]|nr:adenylosuccinate synthase [Chloroflexota bacterium]